MGIRLAKAACRRAAVGLALAGLVGAATIAVASPAAMAAAGGEPPDAVKDFDPRKWDSKAGPDLAPWKASTVAKPRQPEPGPAPERKAAKFPGTDTWDVTLADPGKAATETGRGTKNPVEVSTPAADAPGLAPGKAKAAKGEQLTMKILDHDVAERLGASGFAFTVAGADAAKAPNVPVELDVDYSGFAEAFGGDYAQRLQVVALPACVLQEPRPDDCQATPKTLRAKNHGDDQRLVVSVDDIAALAPAPRPADAAALAAIKKSLANARKEFEADVAAEAKTHRPTEANGPKELDPWASNESAANPAADAVEQASSAATSTSTSGSTTRAPAPTSGSAGATVLLVTAAASGGLGTYQASPMSMTGSWNVAPGTGEFNYSYPIDVPAPGAGSSPSVGLVYSSGAIDGQTTATNNQSSQTGNGWSEFGSAFVERHYDPCYMYGKPVVGTWPDLCFEDSYHNATISLGPVTGTLIPIDAAMTQFRLKDDPGWKVQRTATVTSTGVSEKWKVTGPDGTIYWFGLYTDPETSEGTWSTYRVPIFSDDATEPCWGMTTAGQPAACNMGWRWNLDRVIDPDGNVAMYYYTREMNWYTSCGGWCINDRLDYTRAGTLSRIEYGRRVGSTAPAAGKVTFGTQYRCLYLDARWQDGDGDGTVDRDGTNCPEARTDNSDLFPDVPNDLLCTASACSAAGISPAFFSTRRYSYVRTEVLVGATYQPVAQENFYAAWGTVAGWTLSLSEIMHAGLGPPGLNIYPNTVFSSTDGLLDNRVDYTTGDDATRMRKYRITKVTSPFGGTIDVTYGQPNPCTRTYVPTAAESGATARWDLNGKDCFPQTIRTKDSSFPVPALFHKYLVTRVVERSNSSFANMPSTPVQTDYNYEGTPAWAFDYGAFARGDSTRGWSSWRGYGSVTVDKGESHSRQRFFRGMDGDVAMTFVTPNWVPTGRRTASVSSFDGTYTTPDALSLMGRTLEEEQPLVWHNNSEVGHTVQKEPSTGTLHKYETRATATPPFTTWETPVWAGLSETTETTNLTTRDCNPWPGNCTFSTATKQRRTTTTYDANLQPWKTVEHGWLDDPDDDRCSITTYAVNTTLGMVNYPAENTVRAGNTCTSGEVISHSQTLYDASTTVGAAPTKGNVTLQRNQVDATRYAETATEYDTIGRPKKVTGPSGVATTTAYTPATTNAVPTHTEVTTSGPGIPSATTKTDFLAIFASPTQVTDPNNNVTTYKYDEFGRTKEVRLPTEQSTTDSPNPSLQFSYQVDFDDTSDTDKLPEKPVMVRTRQLLNGSGASQVLHDSYTIYDGLMRERQNQTPSSVAGKMVVGSTNYDGRGLLYDEIEPEAVTTTAFAGYAVPSGGAPWQNRSRHLYDSFGRETRSEWLQGSTSVKANTSTYGLTTVAVTSPNGVTVTNTVDGLGRTTKVEENGGAASNYTYDLAGNLKTVTDPEGNVTSYTYNMAGWRTDQTDADRGAAHYEYDVAGRQTMAQDAAGTQLHTIYDVLGRPKERHAGSPTGTLLASWTYDTATKGVGLPATVTRRNDGKDWVTAVTGYDARQRALGNTLTVPAGIPGLSGATTPTSYTVTQAYDRADNPTATTYPAVGGLAQETVTTAYNGFGLPATLKATSGYTTEYVTGTSYDDRLRPSIAAIGPKNPAHGFQWGLVKVNEYNADQQLSRNYLFNSWSTLPDGVVADHRITYREDGQVTAIQASQGSASWKECYGYDNRARLTSTYTVASGGTCDPANKGGGDQPFERSYTYSAGGRLTERKEDGVATAYTYPTQGAASVRPHAPTKVGTQDYTWNSDGSLNTRTVAGGTETFTWDSEHLLSSIAAPSGTTSFVYDVGGNRLMRTAPDGSHTLYFAGHEVTANAAGTTVTAVRSYRFGGDLVATRSSTGVEYMVSGASGSTEASIAPSAAGLSGSRRYDPYGQARAKTGTSFQTEQGFVGQIEDASTGLSYLNARYYDPKAALFVSTDPLFDTAQPKSLNPYTYGLDNPVGFSDPSGTMSSMTWSMGYENGQLRSHVKSLQGIIKELGAHITELQGIIKEQDRALNEAYTYIAALEAQIRSMQDYIGQLQARIRDLEQQVAYWKGQAEKWFNKYLYWKGQAQYYRSVIGDLVGLAYLPQFRDTVLQSIDAGRGLPNLWLGTYAALSMSLQSQNDQLVGAFNAIAPGALGVINREHLGPEQVALFDAWSDFDADTTEGHQVANYEDRIGDLERELERAQDASSFNLFECVVSGVGTVGGGTVTVLGIVTTPAGGAGAPLAVAGLSFTGVSAVSTYQTCV